MSLIQRLIKAFGNNSVPTIEIFIKPYLLLCTLTLSMGDIQAGQGTYSMLYKLIHELYGEESELETQLFCLGSMF